MKEKPESIMINVPTTFFEEKGNSMKHWMPALKDMTDYEAGLAWFRSGYETMGLGNVDSWECFYHFISCCPIHEVTHVFVCFAGEVQYKAIVVEYIKNSVLENRGVGMQVPPSA